MPNQHTPSTRLTLTCPQCGTEFERNRYAVEHARTSFCSRTCQVASTPRVSVVCEMCARSFSVQPAIARRGDKRFCSWECRVGWYTKVNMALCEACGQPFRAKRWAPQPGKGRFCSYQCSIDGRYGAIISERFWSRVNKDGPIPPQRPELGPCWVWTAGTSDGYGQFFYDGVNGYAHRWSYEQAYGPIPSGMFVCHACDNPPCVQPEHLEAKSQAGNMADAKARGRTRNGRGSRPALHAQ